MKKFLLISCLLSVILHGSAQMMATISGQVLDKSSNIPIEYASVSVNTKANVLVAGNITSEKGRFSLQNIKKGEYQLTISFIGYLPYEKQILVGELNSNFDLGKIFLQVNPTQIEDVTVIGQRSEIAGEMNRKTYEMEDLVAQAGGSVLDAMKIMPGVTIDQDGKVILRGSDKVLVLIDGKQSSLTGFGNQKGLDNIPAANIERIEIINNPSAKYDASGMAGVVNIIYKKEQKNGINGSAGMALGLGAITKPKPDLPTELGSFSPTPKLIPSLDLNFNKEKFKLFFQSEVFLQKKLPNNEFTTRYYDDGRITASQVPENRKQIHYIVKGGFDYLLNANNTFTLSTVYDWEKHNDTAQVPYIEMRTNQRYRMTAWNEIEITGYMNYTAQYEHRFPQTGHKINANLQYTKGWEDETYYINDSSEVQQSRDVTNILATEHTTSLSVDYTKPLKSGRFETGTKLQIRNLPVDYTVTPGENTIIYPGMGSWTHWGESVYAGYLNLVNEKPKYDIEAGLRTEYTTVFYEMDPANIYYQQNDSYNYFELFPNVRLSYKFNPKNKISLFYNRRIDRPGEPELRIFAKSDDHELLKVGNPYLRPQFTQSAEIAYKTSWNNGSLFLSGYFRYINDPYMRVYTIDKTNPLYDVVVKTYANTGSATNRGLELVLSQTLLEIWKVNGNINYYCNKIAAYEGSLLFPYPHTFAISESTGNTWNMKLSNTFSLQRNYTLQLTGIYYAPVNIPQGKQMGRSSIDIGIKKVIMKGKGEINLSASDIFNKYGLVQEIYTEGVRATYENYYETQIINLGFKMKF